MFDCLFENKRYGHNFSPLTAYVTCLKISLLKYATFHHVIAFYSLSRYFSFSLPKALWSPIAAYIYFRTLRNNCLSDNYTTYQYFLIRYLKFKRTFHSKFIRSQKKMVNCKIDLINPKIGIVCKWGVLKPRINMCV